MNWMLTVPLTVCLVHSSLACIILLQNLTGDAGFDGMDDYTIDDREVDDQADQVRYVDDNDNNSNNHLKLVRGKRKTEDENVSEQQPQVQCYVLRNHRLHPLRKRSRHGRGQRRMKHVTATTVKSSEVTDTMIVDRHTKNVTVNESINDTSTNTTNPEETNVTDSIPPMAHHIKMKPKNPNVFKGRKHCIYHEKHQDVINDVSCDGRHTNYEEPVVSKHLQIQSEIPVSYDEYSKKKFNTDTRSPSIKSPGNVIEDIDAKANPQRPVQSKQYTNNIKTLRDPNLFNNQSKVIDLGSETPNRILVSQSKILEKAPEKETQEIDLFTPIKELEAFIAAMSRDDYEDCFQTYWKTILVATLLVVVLLICCFYYCLNGRNKSSNDATLFLIKPDSCMNTNRSSTVKSRKKDKPKSCASSRLIVRGKTYESDTDDYTPGQERKCRANEAYRKYKRNFKRDRLLREEEQSLISPRQDRGYESRRAPKRNCSAFSYIRNNARNNNLREQSCDRVLTNYCFYGNKEIKELFKQDPQHIYHFSSVDGQFGKQYKPDSNVESYAETVTSSARSRFKVTKPCIKKSKYVKKKVINK